LQHFEQVGALYAELDQDPTLLSPRLALALREAAKQKDKSASRGDAADQYYAAADAFDRLAEIASLAGEKKKALDADHPNPGGPDELYHSN
jgi:hypothetical protein